MTHLGYILGADLASATVLIGMIVWVMLDLASQRRKLRRLEEAGLRRRSEMP
jgi:heme exporter protein CcmD